MTEFKLWSFPASSLTCPRALPAPRRGPSASCLSPVLVGSVTRVPTPATLYVGNLPGRPPLTTYFYVILSTVTPVIGRKRGRPHNGDASPGFGKGFRGTLQDTLPRGQEPIEDIILFLTWTSMEIQPLVSQSPSSHEKPLRGWHKPGVRTRSMQDVSRSHAWQATLMLSQPDGPRVQILCGRNLLACVQLRKGTTRNRSRSGVRFLPD